jgi:hypothetical protein
MKNIIKEIINDTLKNRGKWSKTNLTMLMSFVIGSSMAIIDFIFNGFRLDVFLLYMSSTVGFKYFDSKRLKKEEEQH